MKFLDASPNIDSIIPDIARFGGKVANLLFLNQIPGIEVPDFIGLEIKQDPQDQPFQERLKQLLETVGPTARSPFVAAVCGKMARFLMRDISSLLFMCPGIRMIF